MGLLLAAATPPTEYLTLRGIKVTDTRIFKKFPEAMERLLEKLKCWQHIPT